MSTDAHSLLIPLHFPDPDPLPSSFISGFTDCKVTLLGLYEMSEETPQEEKQRRVIEANHLLYSLANQFVRSGDTAEVELLVDTDLSGAPTRIAEERGIEALLVPNEINTLGQLLIPIRDEKYAGPIADFVGTMDEDTIIHTELLHVTEDEDGVAAGEELLGTVKEKLVEAGFPRVSIGTEVSISDDPSYAISQAARRSDLIIMGETEAPSYERVFGRTYQSVADQTEEPVLVVRE